jgi:hypothetical protein
MEVSQEQTASMFNAGELHTVTSPITLVNTTPHGVKTQREALVIVQAVRIQISVPTEHYINHFP